MELGYVLDTNLDTFFCRVPNGTNPWGYVCPYFGNCGSIGTPTLSPSNNRIGQWGVSFLKRPHEGGEMKKINSGEEEDLVGDTGLDREPVKGMKAWVRVSAE